MRRGLWRWERMKEPNLSRPACRGVCLGRASRPVRAKDKRARMSFLGTNGHCRSRPCPRRPHRPPLAAFSLVLLVTRALAQLCMLLEGTSHSRPLPEYQAVFPEHVLLGSLSWELTRVCNLRAPGAKRRPLPPSHEFMESCDEPSP